MKQKILSLVLVFCVCLPAAAQFRHEFSFHTGGGLSSLQYSPDHSKFTSGFGGEAGLGYHFFFNSNWGLGTGIDLSLYNSKLTMMDQYSATTLASAPSGTLFDFAYTYTDYKEAVSGMLLTIPLTLQYQALFGKTVIYAAVGGKIGIPAGASVKTTGDVTTTGYFPSTMVLYDEDMPMQGFSSYDVDQKTDLSLKTAFMLSVEAGAKFRLNDQWNLYAGVYFDYGLNNIGKAEKSDLLAYRPNAASYPAGFAYGSYADMSDKLSPMALGLKVRLSFGRKPFDSVKKEAEPVPITN